MSGCTEIWIGNLRYSTKMEDLRAFFGDLSQEIVEIDFPEHKDDQGFVKNKGFARITFTSNKAAKQAVGFSESKLNGRALLIKMENNYTKQSKRGAKAAEPSSTIFLGNLGYDVERRDLAELCNPFEHLAGVRLGTFEDTGRCKGFGYLDFEDIQSARSAFNALKSNPTLKGRKIRVEFATPEAAKRGKPWLSNPHRTKQQAESDNSYKEENKE